MGKPVGLVPSSAEHCRLTGRSAAVWRAAPDTRPDKISDGTFSQVRGLHGNGLRSRCCCCVPALKCLYLVTRSLDPTGTGRTRWATRWKPALNAFAITFGDRFPAAETY